MTVKGTLKADSLVVARITVDFLANPTKIRALAGLVHEATGQTLAWSRGEAGVFSQATLEKVKELRELMEQDLAQVLFHTPPAVGKPSAVEGLGELLGGTDAPSI